MEERQISAEGPDLAAAPALLRDRHPEPDRPDRHLSPPESQLDRFLMRLSLATRTAPPNAPCWPARDRRDLIAHLPAETRPQANWTPLRRRPGDRRPAPARLHPGPARREASREGAAFSLGMSPRAGLGLLAAARAWALLAGRDHVLPKTCRRCCPRSPATACAPPATVTGPSPRPRWRAA